MKPLNFLFVFWALNINLAQGSEIWKLETLGSFELSLNIPNLGGLSAINVSQSGKKFVAISDKGQYFEGEISRDLNGAISDINIFKNGALLDSAGKNLSGRNTDSESLATIDNKGFYISFESNHRIMFHKSLDATATFLPRHENFKLFRPNKGLEAIAVNAAGEIFAIPEEPPINEIDFPVYKLTGKTWSVFSRFPSSGTFLVTDAVFLPNNDLLILERDYHWGTGFKMQLRILNIKGNTITGQTKLLSLNSGLHNHEGVSIWQDDSKNFFITTISDNNFLPFVASEIKEFKLKNKKRH